MTDRTSTPRLYNPGWLTDDDVVAGFIARRPLLEFLTDELRHAPVRGNVQHYLLVGVRGAGKTTLLKRLAVAIRREPDLADHLLAVSFPEELYQVKHLSDLWWAACEALVEALERAGLAGEAKALAERIDDRPPAVGVAAERDDAGLRCLLETCQRLGKRPVLLIDNLNLVMRRIDKRGRKVNDPDSPAYWALREALSTSDCPMVIGGSVRLSEPFIGGDRAFYEFFIPKRLAKLELEEVQAVLRHLAAAFGPAELPEQMQARPGRIRALYDLTGGNPRALGLIFELIRQGPSGRAVDDFERLLDLTTPYYKARFEDLPEQPQVVLHALATLRRESEADGGTAAEVAARAGLETRLVSAQLETLIDEGLVEKEGGGKGQGRVWYRIAEQLFRLWIQMRTNRRLRLAVIGLAEYLEALWDEEALREAARAEGDGPATPGRAKLALALSETSDDAVFRRVQQSRAADAVLELAARGEGTFREAFLPEDLPEDVHGLATCRERCEAALPKLRGAAADAEAVCGGLVGALRWTLGQKQGLVERLCGGDSTVVSEIREGLAAERAALLRDGLTEDDIARLYRWRGQGLMPLPGLTPEYVEKALTRREEHAWREVAWKLLQARRIEFPDDAVAGAWLAWGKAHFADAPSEAWAAVARAFRRARRFGAAKSAVEVAFAQNECARAWHERGALADEADRDATAAEIAYRRAIALDPSDAWPWNGLGGALGRQNGRHEEAESACQRAIEIDPAYALGWNNLANVIVRDPRRVGDAERAYRRAIDLDPSEPRPWSNLGLLLNRDAKRASEADQAYRRAIELDPNDALPWNNLGNLLMSDPNRFTEAEHAYRRAIELDPQNSAPWNNLGVLLERDAERADEAEQAFRRAIELDPGDFLHWKNLGFSLANDNNRLLEAETNLARAAELKPDDAWVQVKLYEVRRQKRITPIAEAVTADDWPTIESCLRPVATDENLARMVLADDTFLQTVVAGALAHNQGQRLLTLFRELGFDRIAAPLLLALDAALDDATTKLRRAPPEMRSAALRLYERILAALPA